MYALCATGALNTEGFVWKLSYHITPIFNSFIENFARIPEAVKRPGDRVATCHLSVYRYHARVLPRRTAFNLSPSPTTLALGGGCGGGGGGSGGSFGDSSVRACQTAQIQHQKVDMTRGLAALRYRSRHSIPLSKTKRRSTRPPPRRPSPLPRPQRERERGGGRDKARQMRICRSKTHSAD